MYYIVIVEILLIGESGKEIPKIYFRSSDWIGWLQFISKIISKEVFKVATPLVLQYLISVSTWLVFFLLIASRGDDAKAISTSMQKKTWPSVP